MYNIFGKTFRTFEEAEQWAWEMYRIPPHPIRNPGEALKQQICLELEAMIATFEEDISDRYYGG